MNRFLLIFIAVLFISSCYRKKYSKNDLYLAELKGDVSKVTMFFFGFESSGHGYKEKMTYKYVIMFNEEGNIKFQTTTTLPDTGATTIEQVVYNYNERGQKTAARHPSKSKPYSTWLYDANGNLIEQLSFNDIDGAILERQKIVNSDKDTTEHDYYLPNGKPDGKTIVISKRYNVTNILTYDEHGKLTNQSNYQYNSEGDKIKRIEKADNETAVFTYKYSDFDSNGNYLKSNIYYNGKNFQIEKREIIYFPKNK